MFSGYRLIMIFAMTINGEIYLNEDEKALVKVVISKNRENNAKAHKAFRELKKKLAKGDSYYEALMNSSFSTDKLKGSLREAREISEEKAEKEAELYYKIYQISSDGAGKMPILIEDRLVLSDLGLDDFECFLNDLHNFSFDHIEMMEQELGAAFHEAISHDFSEGFEESDYEAECELEAEEVSEEDKELFENYWGDSPENYAYRFKKTKVFSSLCTKLFGIVDESVLSPENSESE